MIFVFDNISYICICIFYTKITIFSLNGLIQLILKVTHSPSKVLPPIHFIITEIKPILCNPPRTYPICATTFCVPRSLKRIKFLPYVVPFHGTLHVVATPQIWPHNPAKIIMFLHGSTTKIHFIWWTPNDQRHRWIVCEAINHTNIIFITAKQILWSLHYDHYNDNGGRKA